MAAHNVTPIEQVEDQLHRGYADLTAMQRSGLDAVLASSRAMIRGYEALGTEALAFAQSRMKNSLDVAKSLAACSSPDAALALQAEYAQSATKAYMDEFRTLGELSSRMITETLEPLRRGTEVVTAKAEKSAAA